MKEEGIKIRINTQIKKDFQEICDYENITMSNKLHEFILHEVATKKRVTTEKLTTDLFKGLGYDITIVETPIFLINDEGDVISSDAEGHVMVCATCQDDILTFVERNKDKRIYIHLSSCDFDNNKIRGIVR